MHRLQLFLSYRGSRFHGWQRQKNSKLTIQETLEIACSRVLGQLVTIVSSGRTDAGVHARVQVVHFDVSEKTYHRYLTENFASLPLRFNALLPKDVRVLEVKPAPKDFHAQKHVKKKKYVYFINTNRFCPPELTDYCWHLRLPLDWDQIESAARLFEGEHNFKSFCSSDSSAKTFTRTIDRVMVQTVDLGGFWGDIPLKAISFEGKGFLKYQVRSMVGTLMKVGEKKIPAEQIRQALASDNRKLVGPTAPPQGLFLWDILYQQD